VAEQRRKPPTHDAAPPPARGTPQAVRLALPANDNPVPRAVIVARAVVALAALGAAAAGAYWYFD